MSKEKEFDERMTWEPGDVSYKPPEDSDADSKPAEDADDSDDEGSQEPSA